MNDEERDRNNEVTRRDSSDETRGNRCDVCNAFFLTKMGLTNHLPVHAGMKKPFDCYFCPLSFHSSSNLSNHEDRHVRGKLYRHELCDDL